MEEKLERRQLTNSTVGSVPGHDVWNRLVLSLNRLRKPEIALMTIIDQKQLDFELSIARFGS